jgi:phosphatidate cytidylyltransferase
MLKDRLRTSAFLITAVAVLLYLDGHYSIVGAEGLWLLPLLMFFSLGTAWDITTMVLGSGRACGRNTALIATAIVTLSSTIPMLWAVAGSIYPADCPVGELGWIVVGGIASVFVVLMLEMKRYDAEQKGTLERTFSSVFVSAYAGLPFALMVALRSLGDGNWGLAALLTMIAVTKSADAGAYFAGKSFGKHKLIPRLSPGKTWQGLVGGIVIATIVAFACLQWLFPAISGGAVGPVLTPAIPGLASPWLGAIVLGPLLAIAGLIGDLAESMVKRDSQAKDSGTLLPGLGGVWDVTDSLIAAVLPAFLCFAAGVAA